MITIAAAPSITPAAAPSGPDIARKSPGRTKQPKPMMQPSASAITWNRRRPRLSFTDALPPDVMGSARAVRGTPFRGSEYRLSGDYGLGHIDIAYRGVIH